MRLFIMKLPFRFRIWYRWLLSLFGKYTYQMGIDDINDRMELLKIDIGFAIMKPIKDFVDGVERL